MWSVLKSWHLHKTKALQRDLQLFCGGISVSWEGYFHQGAGEGGVYPVENLVRGREEGRERRII